LTFTPTPNGNYTYQRRYAPGPPGSRPQVDNGVAVLTGSHLHLRQVPTPGLGAAVLGVAPPRQRHVFYRLRPSGDKGRGLTFQSQLDQGREELQRLAPGMDNDHVQLLVDGGEFFPLLEADLRSARRSIYMQSYIFADDALGSRVGRFLAEKAREGVQVRLLCDDFDSWISDELMGIMRGAGVEVIVQNGRQEGLRNTLRNVGQRVLSLGGLFGSGRARPHRGLLNHDHRKIVHYVSAWHDVHARVEGDVVRDMEAAFHDAWTQAGGQLGTLPPADPVTQSPDWWPGSMDVTLVQQIPGVRKDIKRRYLEEIDTARRSIYIENAFFLHDGVIDALKRRARDGVDVVVIIPTDEKNNSRVVQEAFNWVQNDVVRSGVRLYKYRDRMTHGKVAVFDGLVSTVGSCNLDPLALEELYEANLFIDDDPGFARLMEQRVFRVDIPKSDLVKVRRSSVGERLKSGLFYFFRRFL
jgi:cardiolipin synthase